MAWHQGSGVNTSYYFAPASSSTYGDSVTFTATVAVTAPGAGTPSGNVQFKDGGVNLGSPVALSGTTAQLTTSALNAGVHNITAQYVGDTNFNTSTSGQLAHTVAQKSLTASIVGNPTKPYDGNSNATLTSANFSLTGLVGSESFTITKTTGNYDSANAGPRTVSTTLAPADFTAGVGTLASNYVLPTTASGPGQINAADQTINVTTAAPASAIFGQSFNVAATGGGSGNPVVIAGSGACSGGGNGSAVITMTSGTGTCVVTYNQTGNSNYNAAPQVSSNTNAVKAATNVVAVSAIGTYGGQVILTATLNRTDAPAGVLSGMTVDFTLNGNSVGSNVTNGLGQASVTVYLTSDGLVSGTRINAGSYPTGVGASFAGDANYSNSSDNDSLTVNQKQVTASVTAANKTYDSTNAATINTCSVNDVEAGDTVTCVANGPNTFADANAGAGKTVTATNIVLGGSSSGNYVLNPTSATTTAEIFQAVADCSSIAGYTGTYNAAAHGASGGCTGVDAGGAAIGSTLDLGAPFTNYPGGTANWSFEGGTNYTDQSGSVLIVINKADASCSINGYTGVYDAVSHGATGSCTGVAAETMPTIGSLDLGAQFTNVPGGTANWSFTGGTNYNDQSSTASIVITPATATIVVNGYSVQYDGLTHGLSGSATGVGGADLSGSLTFGAAVTNVPGGSITWSFNAGTNYNTDNGSATVTITQATSLTVVTCPLSVPYNSLAQEPCTVSVTGVGGLSETPSANYVNNENVGFATASYNYAGDLNHTGSSDSETFEITAIALTINGAVAQDKVYDGNQTASVDFTAAALATPIVGDLVSIDSSGYSATFATADAGNDIAVTVTGVTLTGADSGNYTVSQPSVLTADITKKPLVLTGVVALPKNYDGNSVAIVDFDSTPATLQTFISGDDVGFDVTNYAANFDTKNAGESKPVTVTGIVLTGTDKDNYSFTQPAGLIADIYKAPLSANIIGDPTKVYDGITDATLSTANFQVLGTVLSESFTVSESFGTYNSPNVVGATSVTAALEASDFVEGTDTLAANYTFPTSASGPGHITPATPTVTVSFAASPVTYNAAAHPASVTVTGVPVDGVLSIPANGSVAITYLKSGNPSGEPVNAGNYTASAFFDSANTNYFDASSSAYALLTIDKAIADCTSIVGYTGTYDATSHGADGSCSGVDAGGAAAGSSLDLGDVFTNVPGGTAHWVFTGGMNYTDQSGDAAIVINKATATISVPDYTVGFDALPHGLSGTATGVGLVDLTSSLTFGAPVTNVPGGLISWSFDAGTNYNTATGSATVTITKANAVCTINGYSDVYDAQPHGATGSCAGVAADPTAVGSSLNLGAQFTDVPGGTSHWVFTGGTNYSDQEGDVSISISKADANVVITDYVGVYDANAHGVTGAATGVGGVDLSSSLNLGGQYTNFPGGTVSWSFSGGTNYLDENGTANVTISPADANVTVNGYSGTYDGSAHSATGSATGVGGVDLNSLLVLGDSFANVPGGTANWTFNAGSVNANYIPESGSVPISISKANAICTVTGYNVTYDGSSHTATGTCTGVLSEGLSGLDLSGTTHTNAGNYNDTWTFADATGNYNNQGPTGVLDVINHALVTATAGSGSNVYDAATHSPSACVVTGAYVGSLSCVNDPANVGPNVGTTTTNPITIGPDLANFVVTPVTGTYEITKRGLVITAVTDSKPYDGNTSSSALPTVSGLQGSTDNISGLTQTFDNKNVGSGKTLSVGPFTVNDGNGGNNYEVSTVQDHTGVITQVTLTLTAVTNTKGYDGNNTAAAIPTVGGLQAGDSVTGLAETYNNKNAGTGKTLSVSAYSINDGNGGNNYVVSTVQDNTGVINQRSITVTAVTETKVYDGNTSSVGIPTVSAPGIAVGDTAAFTQSYQTKHFGIGNKVLIPTGVVNDGNSGNNYAVSFVNFTAGTITQKPITVTAVAATKPFDGNNSSAGVPIIAPPLVGGDTSNFIQTYDNQFVGTGKTLTPSGTANDGNGGLNYTYTFVPVNTGVITTIYCFNGFLSPVGGSVESGNGGSFADPVRSFKLNSTIPFKFALYSLGCSGSPIVTGIHTIQLAKYSNATDSEPPIDATPTDAATTGNQFRLTGTEWHFNLDTKRTPGVTAGTWLITATLLDGSKKTVWISIKK